MAKPVRRKFIKTAAYYSTAFHGFVLEVGMRTKNESNTIHPNWKVTSGERKRQRTKVMKALASSARMIAVKEVIFTRFAPSAGLDDDGLRSALKSVRDQALCWLQGENHLKAKANDGPACGLTFTYEQYRHEAYGVRVVFR